MDIANAAVCLIAGVLEMEGAKQGVSVIPDLSTTHLEVTRCAECNCETQRDTPTDASITAYEDENINNSNDVCYEFSRQPEPYKGKCNKCGKRVKKVTTISDLKYPQLLVLNIHNNDVNKGRSRKFECLETLKVNDSTGCHEYKLIGVVDAKSPKHVVARIKVEDGEWYEVDDLKQKEPVIKMDFEIDNKMRRLVFYERVA